MPKSVKSIVNMPKAEWEKVRQTLDKTYRLLDTTLNMVIFWLGDILDEPTMVAVTFFPTSALCVYCPGVIPQYNA